MLHYKFNFKLSIWIVSLLLFSLFSLGCQNEVGAGPKAPDFSLPDLSGKMVTLKQFHGSVVIVDFWATWCPPCRVSLPELVNLQEKYKNKGLVVLGISTDDPRNVSNEYLKSFCEKFKINYTVLRYDYNVIEAYFGREAPSLPTVYVIDREGQIRDKFVGLSPEALQKSVERLFE